MQFPDFDFQPHIQPHPPEDKHFGIGIIGSGGIVRHAHLPAYRMAGFSVVALAGRNQKAVEELGAEYEIPNCVFDWRALMDDPKVRVVDIAIPGEGRLEIVRAAACAGKHLLIQKPLANTIAQAREIVETAREAGVLLAVNQNARYAPAYRAARHLLQRNFVGEVFDITHELRNHQDSAPFYQDSWNAREERYQIAQYSVHHLDLMRFWMNREPEFVFAQTSRKPQQNFRGEMTATIILDFGEVAQGVLIERNAGWLESEVSAKFRIEGTEGMIEGDAMNNSIQVRHRNFDGEVWKPQLNGEWFPDAFAATMGELLDVIAGDGVLSIGGEDNLRTLALVEAAYISARERRAVAPFFNMDNGVLA